MSQVFHHLCRYVNIIIISGPRHPRVKCNVFVWSIRFIEVCYCRQYVSFRRGDSRLSLSFSCVNDIRRDSYNIFNTLKLQIVTYLYCSKGTWELEGAAKDPHLDIVFGERGMLWNRDQCNRGYWNWDTATESTATEGNATEGNAKEGTETEGIVTDGTTTEGIAT